MVTIEVKMLNNFGSLISSFLLRGPDAAKAFSQIFEREDLVIDDGDRFIITVVAPSQKVPHTVVYPEA